MGTKTFQALRIFVNNELNELYNGISLLHTYLKPRTGRLAVISFHSLEDRIAKNHFKDVRFVEEDQENELVVVGFERERRRKTKFQMNRTNMNLSQFASSVRTQWTALNKKVITPDEDEIERNPRARSAKLRVAIKN